MKIKKQTTNKYNNHYVKGIKNFEQHRNTLSDIHQNLISTKLHQGATEYKFLSIYAH